MIHYYCPEMKETIPEGITTHAILSHYGRHYFLKSLLGPDVIHGVGVVYTGQRCLKANILQMQVRTEANDPFLGYYEYKVTMKAFERLGKVIEIGVKTLLD